MHNGRVFLTYKSLQLPGGFGIGFPSFPSDREENHLQPLSLKRKILRFDKGANGAYMLVAACHKDYFHVLQIVEELRIVISLIR